MAIPSRCLERGWPLVLCLLLAGCGSSRTEVAGVVTLDGQPVEGAAVSFKPTAGGPAAFAATDAQGRYRLESANRPGVTPGTYEVTVRKQKILGVGANEMVGPGGVRTQELLPTKYADPTTSGFLVTVPTANYDLPLTK
jgi:hypothetical protein